MSGKNDESTGIAIGLGLIFAGFVFMAAAVFILLALFTAVLSVMALLALWKPLRIGKITIEPHEARSFLLRGIIGTFLLPFAALALAPLFDFGVRDEWFVYLFIGGYMIGSVGIEFIIEKVREANEAAEAEQASQLTVIPPKPVSPPEQQPFEFARWDDEEER
ncbi:hypothetical protein [Devosia sp. SL43]|uniref:hypothetical protein n=1 Tax=Devosia sp. SL43 TaxID=2806348 RepID=UPI001F18D719|nr:hypothetical protein [Devosia sp. SL43]UJW86902.1 hypothetical protein IM737_06560 [Devosia sp. SL43]